MEWFSYNAFSQKWYNANGDVVDTCEVNNKLRSVQREVATLRAEVEKLRKLVPPQGESILRELFKEAGCEVTFVDATPKESPDE